jgi:hypothetical protein
MEIVQGMMLRVELGAHGKQLAPVAPGREDVLYHS